MSPNTTHMLMIAAVVVALIFGRHRLRNLGARGDELDRLGAELRQMPVYSAETTQGKEAEFIRDRLPNRFPWWLLLAGALVGAAAAWWLFDRAGG